MVRLFDFKSDKHFVASSDRTNLKVYQLSHPITSPSSIRKTHWREIVSIISSRDDGSDDDDDDAAAESQLQEHCYDGLLFFDGHGKIEGREALTKLAQHLTRLHLMVSPGGYCFQDAAELGEYKDFGVHYLRLNDQFDWSRHGVNLVTTTVWPRLKLKYVVPKQGNPSRPATVEGGVSKEKYDELKTLVKEKDKELEKLREEMDDELQKLSEERDEELQNLREEMEKASEAKNEELRKLRKEKDEELRKLIKKKDGELQVLKKGGNDGETLKKIRKEKDEELRKLRIEMEEEMEKLRRQKDEAAEEVEKAMEEETMKKLNEKDDELRKLRKDKDEELRKLLQKKEIKLQIIKKGKDEELQKLRDEMEEETERLIRVKDEEVEKIENEKEELQKLLKKKDDELKALKKVKDGEAISQKLQKEKVEESQKLTREKDEDMEKLRRNKDEEENKAIEKKKIDDTLRQLGERDDELLKLRQVADEMEIKMREEEEQVQDLRKMKKCDELEELREKLSSSLADIARVKKELEQCCENSWSDSARKTKIFLELQLSMNQEEWQIHSRQRRPVPPETFRCEGIDTYSGYRYFYVPKMRDGQLNPFCEIALLVNEEMTARSLLPPLVHVETRIVGQFDVNNWWFTKALHREGGVTMLAYYDGHRDHVRVNTPMTERPIRLPYSKNEDVYADRRFFFVSMGNEIRLAFAYRV
ncbi:unnamed protein product [Linum tenue]|uniref:Uncharacterized protein n=1 Tax=Linum tenue TaxID=586396 RepID=A0AAV0P8W2_9ROSI|nr:unnamed protein product [Linum tenue]